MALSTTLSMFFLGLALVLGGVSGCGDKPEPLPPPKPVVFKKKISLPVQAGKSAVEMAAKTPAAKAETKPAVKAQLPAKKPLVKPQETEPKVTVEGLEQKVASLYNPKGRIDPFESIFALEIKRVEAGQQIRERKRPLTPLEKVDLSQLKLVGIIVSPSGNKALVEDPSGKGFIIKKGTYVGTNFGKVVKIQKDKVIVKEEIEDLATGLMKPQTTELILLKKLGDG